MTDRASLRPLRPYQADAIAKAREAFRSGKNAVLLVCPTGGGKTRIGTEIVLGATSRGGKVLWLAHREELLTQAQASIVGEGLTDVGIIAPWARRQHATVQVASVQTLAAQMRKDRVLPEASVVVFDEAHHFVADEWGDVAKGLRGPNGKPPKIVGLTATPERGDGRPLGDIFDALIPVSSVRELQELGVLVPCVTLAPDGPKKALAREPVDAYRERGWGERCFVFCVTVAHAEMVAQTFRDAGAPAAVIAAETPWDLRRARLAAFKAQDPTPLRRIGSTEDAPLVLVNVYALTEGVDVPEASVCITARGIGHAGMMRQMVGRVLRAAEGKTRAIWWDLRGQSNRPKIGLPEADCEYSLDGKVAIAVREDRDDPPRKCKACGGVFLTWAVDRATGRRQCPLCGEPAPALEAPDVRECEVFAHGSGATEDERAELLRRWAETAVDRGFRPGWVSVRYAEKFGTYPPHGAVDAALLAARKLYGVRVTAGEVEAERARLTKIATDKGIPMSWVAKKLAEKYGEGAAA